jgi:hypothetical protein
MLSNVDTAQVILPKQATPWYQLWVLAVWTYLLTREKSISLLGTPAREKTLLWMELSGRRCRFWEVSFFKIRILFFCDTVLPQSW